jgi:hypothetical protein
MSHPGERDGSWTLLTGHGHVLVEIARNPGARIRDISAGAGLTERTVQAIVADLEAAGYLTRTRTGRRTRYTVNPTARSATPPRMGSGSARSSPCWPPQVTPPKPGRPQPPAAALPRQPRLTTTALDPAPQVLGALADPVMRAGLGAGSWEADRWTCGCRGDRAAGKEVIPVSRRDKAGKHRPGSQGQGQTGSWEGCRESAVGRSPLSGGVGCCSLHRPC